MAKFDKTELDDLKARKPLSKLFAELGTQSKGSDKERWASCCFHGEKTPSLKINDEAGIYHCFGCGANGDHFSALKEILGKSFPEAVEYLGGTRLLTTEERKAIDERAAKAKTEEQQQRARSRGAAEKLFEARQPIKSTIVERYLAMRGLVITPAWTFDLGFIPDLRYTGFADANAESQSDLGRFPAMIAAIRDAAGAIIGVHRTYIDPALGTKLQPPGDRKRNAAKKVMGEQRGGMILLSQPSERMAIGEGIETTRSWYALGLGGDDVSLAAAVSLGNLSGSATGSLPHPKDPTKRVPNGEPDPARPGIILPSVVRDIILLGDGDSDPYMTRGRLVVAGRRFRSAGIGVVVAMAPEGKDFGDVLESDEDIAA